MSKRKPSKPCICGDLAGNHIDSTGPCVAWGCGCKKFVEDGLAG